MQTKLDHPDRSDPTMGEKETSFLRKIKSRISIGADIILRTKALILL